MKRGGGGASEEATMELTALAGNAQIKAQLAHREGDLAHAYIVAGPAGSGRHTLAAQMAAALVCSAQPQLRPCGRCSHCRKAAGGIHPDITVIAGSGGKPITVDQVRALRTDAYVRPNEAERKVYLLERADRMNASAQNAMLKLLEDGPAYAVFFLLAENGSALLPTVRSRCETLELAPVSPAQAEEWLAKAFPGRTAEEIRRAYGEMMDYCLGLRPDFAAGVLPASPEGAAHFADVRALFLLDLGVLVLSALVLLL